MTDPHGPPSTFETEAANRRAREAEKTDAAHGGPDICGALNGMGAICRKPKGHSTEHPERHVFEVREVAMPGEELPEDRPWWVSISPEEMGL